MENGVSLFPRNIGSILFFLFQRALIISRVRLLLLNCLPNSWLKTPGNSRDKIIVSFRIVIEAED